MPVWLGLVIAALAINFFFMYRASMRKRLRLASYATYLLLDDKIRESHKANLRSFIIEHPGDNAATMGLAVSNAVENMADQLGADGSLLAANAMAWAVRNEDE